MILNSSEFARQFEHLGSTNPVNDVLELQVYNTGDGNITPSAIAINGNGHVGIGTITP